MANFSIYALWACNFRFLPLGVYAFLSLKYKEIFQFYLIIQVLLRLLKSGAKILVRPVNVEVFFEKLNNLGREIFGAYTKNNIVQET